jgi:hypothetical protein
VRAIDAALDDYRKLIPLDGNDPAEPRILRGGRGRGRAIMGHLRHG